MDIVFLSLFSFRSACISAFCSRAEYRILLRQDNADQRLTALSHSIGLADDERMRRVEEKQRQVSELTALFQDTSVSPSEANEWLLEHDSALLSQRVRLDSLLLRPELGIRQLVELTPDVAKVVKTMPEEVLQEVETAIKYHRYIEKEQEVANRLLKFEDISLPADYDFFQLEALSYESREKLNRYRPATLGQASRISGVSPADLSVLLLTFAH